MTSISRITRVLLPLFFLAGCATLNESECVNADWRMIGMEDGAKGKLPSNIGRHRSACAKHNITPNMAQYREGHDEGVTQYCTDTNGYNLGKHGGRYNGVCPADLEMGFLQGYNVGIEFYNLSSEIRTLDRSISAKKKEMEELKTVVREKEQQVISDETTVELRSSLLDEIKELQKSLGELEAEILEDNKTKAVKESQLEQHSGNWGYH